MPKRYKAALKVIFALSILLLLLCLIDVRELIVTFSNMNLEQAICFLWISVIMVYISALKWQAFLTELGSKISIFKLFNLYLMGYFVNLFMPSYVAGDAARSWFAGKQIGQHQAFTATILERLTGFAAMLALGSTAAFLSDGVPWSMRAAVLLISFAFVVALFAALSSKSIRFIGKLPQGELLTKHLSKIQEGIHLARRNRRLLIETLLISFFFHGMTIVNTLVAAYLVGWWEVPIRDLFLVIPLVLLIGSLPLTPSGLGVQEGAFVFFLSQLGASKEQALAIGFLLRAKTYVLAVFGGAVWLKLGMRRKE